MTGNAESDAVRQFKAAFAANPRSVIHFPPEILASIEQDELDDMRLTHARKRFAGAVRKIGMIRLLAAQNQLDALDSEADLVPLLYNHETLKSYPQTWLETGEFSRLTKWLGKLCAVDLSDVDASGCTLIEDWMHALKDGSDIDLQISAGADGKSAFLPRSKSEWAYLQKQTLSGMQTARDADGHSIGLRPGVDRVPLIYLGARRGARSMSRFLDHYEECFGEGLVDTLLEYNDSDLLSLAGRIRDASKKGEAGLVQIKSELLARKDEIARLNADKPRRMEALMQRLLNDYRGKRIIIQGTMQMVYDLALRFREMGVASAYSPDSLFLCGSGFADGIEPPNWKQEVCETLGVPESAIRIGYSMQEALWTMHLCSHNRFHLPVTIIPFLLDEQSEKPLPRTGTRTGRFGFFDLLPEDSWGGFLTGDRLTIHWDQPCGCGRKTAYADSPIVRITEKLDDKISCAGTASALEEATDFLLRA